MKTKVFSFRAPVDFVPSGISVKDFVYDLYEKAKTPVNTTVDAGVNTVVDAGGRRFDWSSFLLGIIVGTVLVYGYIEMKRRYDEETKIEVI